MNSKIDKHRASGGSAGPAYNAKSSVLNGKSIMILIPKKKNEEK